MKDKWGDRIDVEAVTGSVSVSFEKGKDFIDMELTPKDARRLARKIKRAAKKVEACGC